MTSNVFPILWVGIIFGLIALFFLHGRKSKEQLEEERVNRQLAIEEGIKKKILLPNGKPACVVCKQAVATENWPVIQRSWLDRITALKDLYALTPRYVITDGEGEDYEYMLCRHHKRMCMQKWNELLSAKRTQIQSVVSQVESELSQMEAGAMLLYLQKQHEKSSSLLDNIASGQAPRLPIRDPVDSIEGTISLPPMSTEGEAEEEA